MPHKQKKIRKIIHLELFVGCTETKRHSQKQNQSTQRRSQAPTRQPVSLCSRAASCSTPCGRRASPPSPWPWFWIHPVGEDEKKRDAHDVRSLYVAARPKVTAQGHGTGSACCVAIWELTYSHVAIFECTSAFTLCTATCSTLHGPTWCGWREEK